MYDNLVVNEILTNWISSLSGKQCLALEIFLNCTLMNQIRGRGFFCLDEDNKPILYATP